MPHWTDLFFTNGSELVSEETIGNEKRTRFRHDPENDDYIDILKRDGETVAAAVVDLRDSPWAVEFSE